LLTICTFLASLADARQAASLARRTCVRQIFDPAAVTPFMSMISLTARRSFLPSAPAGQYSNISVIAVGALAPGPFWHRKRATEAKPTRKQRQLVSQPEQGGARTVDRHLDWVSHRSNSHRKLPSNRYFHSGVGHCATASAQGIRSAYYQFSTVLI